MCPALNPRVPLGNIIIALACAIATTAPDLLKPEGTTVVPEGVKVALALIKRVKGLGLVKIFHKCRFDYLRITLTCAYQFINSWFNV